MVIVSRYVLSFSYDLKNWSQANRECQKEGYHLVKIDSDLLTEAIIQNR